MLYVVSNSLPAAFYELIYLLQLFEVTQEAHLAWSMPLSMTLVTICLIVVMGPTTIVGLAILVIFVPFIERVASKMLSYRHRRVKKTDERVEIISAMLQGVSSIYIFFSRLVSLFQVVNSQTSTLFTDQSCEIK